MSDKMYFIVDPSPEDLYAIKNNTYDYKSKGIPEPDADSVCVSILPGTGLNTKISREYFVNASMLAVELLKRQKSVSPPIKFTSDELDFVLEWIDNVGLVLDLDAKK